MSRGIWDVKPLSDDIRHTVAEHHPANFGVYNAFNLVRAWIATFPTLYVTCEVSRPSCEVRRHRCSSVSPPRLFLTKAGWAVPCFRVAVLDVEHCGRVEALEKGFIRGATEPTSAGSVEAALDKAGGWSADRHFRLRLLCS